MHLKHPIAIAALAGAACLGQSPNQLKLVKDSPFSAEAVTQSTQDLAEGNRIIRQTTALIARDSEGRTRREQKLGDTGTSIVFIQDPVAGVYYVLDTQAQSMRRIPVQTIESTEPPGTTRGTTSLGNQTIEGLLAEGTRLRQTVPAGKAGNDQPLEVISETWYSRDLQIVVMHKLVDPRIGEVDYKVTDIQLGEPAESLFQVPKDYKIQDEPPPSQPRIKIPIRGDGEAR